MGNEPVQEGEMEGGAARRAMANDGFMLHRLANRVRRTDKGGGLPNPIAHPVSETTNSDQWSFPALCMAPAVPDV